MDVPPNSTTTFPKAFLKKFNLSTGFFCFLFSYIWTKSFYRHTPKFRVAHVSDTKIANFQNLDLNTEFLLQLLEGHKWAQCHSFGIVFTQLYFKQNSSLSWLTRLATINTFSTDSFNAFQKLNGILQEQSGLVNTYSNSDLFCTRIDIMNDFNHPTGEKELIEQTLTGIAEY